MRRARISPRRFLDRRNKYPDVRDKVTRAEAESVADVLGVVKQAAEDGDWRALTWFLERRHGYQKNDGLPPDEVREFTDTVQQAIREELGDDEGNELIEKIGAELAELGDG